MLVKNVGGERCAASMVKNSEFYIELAKFVQAYTMILSNPNDFLKEIGEPEINEKSDYLSWAQFVKILQTCDLGFAAPPEEKDLIVMYNYALEMGSISGKGKVIANVQDVADAQKHFYNFVDENAGRAEQDLAKQQEILNNRDREAQRVDNELAKIKAKNIVCLVFMVLGVLSFAFGIVSLFVPNVVANSIGAFMSSYKNIAGGIILIVLGIVLFVCLNGVYLKTKYSFMRLKDASKTIFERSDAAYNDTLVLKNKLNVLKEDLKVVKNELADKEKTNDVEQAIEKLVETNKYYKQFSSGELLFETGLKPTRSEEVLAPVKLTKEEHENVRNVSKEAIEMTGTFDEEAYNAKFERSRQKGNSGSEKQEIKETESESQQEQAESSENQAEQEQALNEQAKAEQERMEELSRKENEKLEEIAEEEDKQKEDDLDYLKDILGLD